MAVPRRSLLQSKPGSRIPYPEPLENPQRIGNQIGSYPRGPGVLVMTILGLNAYHGDVSAAVI